MTNGQAVQNKEGRLGRISYLAQAGDFVLVSYYNDGNRVYPPWEWTDTDSVQPVNDELVADRYLTLDEMRAWQESGGDLPNVEPKT